MGIPRTTLDDMDSFPLVGLAVTDRRGLIIGWDPGAERLLGHTPAQALGRPAARLLGLESAEGSGSVEGAEGSEGSGSAEGPAGMGGPTGLAGLAGLAGVGGAEGPEGVGGGGPQERHTVLPLRHRDGGSRTLPLSYHPLEPGPSGTGTGSGSEAGTGTGSGTGTGTSTSTSTRSGSRSGTGTGSEAGSGTEGGTEGGAGPGAVLVIGPPQGPSMLQEWDAPAGWVLEASPMAITVYDTDLRCVWQSDRMRRLIGVSDEQRHGRLPTDILTGPDAVEWERRIRLALLTGEEQVGEIKGSILAEPGSRVLSVSATPLRDGLGQPVGVFTTMTDVSVASRARERLALLNDASVRIGSTLDLTQTGRELTEVAVPRLADFARVDLLELLLRGDEPAPGPIAGAVRLRRIAEMSLFEGVTETRTTADDSDVYLAGSPAAICLASGRSAMYRTTDPVIHRWVSESPARHRRITRFGAHSWILVPVKARGTTLGVVMFCRTRDTPEPFEPDDMSLAQDLVARAAVCLDNARRYTRERTAAIALQRSLLPQRLPNLSAAQVASRYLPASASTGVGGDWFDVIRLSGARVALVVGDVVGHGIHAAATMGRLRTAVRTLADVDPSPEELLTRLDDLVIELATEAGDEEGGPGVGDAVADIGATCLYAVYDPASGRCSLARAGHPAPVLAVPDGPAEFLSIPAGPPLGLGGVPFESAEVVLPPGSLLALYTDGLVESRQHDLDVGLEALRGALSGRTASLEDLCDDVVRRLIPNGPADDAALLLVRSRMLDARRVAVWDVPAEASAVARVRAESVGKLESWGLEEAAFVTELVVSELVTNAIRYGDSPIQLRLIHDDVLTCEVSDANSAAPHMRRARVFDEGGRGLPLVAQLTNRWGTRQTPAGKTIWCEQTLPTGTGEHGQDRPERLEAA